MTVSGPKPFRVSDNYLDWAHSSAAGDGARLAIELFDQPIRGAGEAAYRLIESEVLVAEIADVAELFVGGSDSDLRAAAVRARARKWLGARGLTVSGVLSAHRTKEQARELTVVQTTFNQTAT